MSIDPIAREMALVSALFNQFWMDGAIILAGQSVCRHEPLSCFLLWQSQHVSDCDHRRLEDRSHGATLQSTSYVPVPDHAIPISIKNKAMLPQFTSKTRACIYSQDGRCVGMLSPELFQNLNSFSLCKGLRATHPNLPPTEGCSLQTGGPACAQTKMHITIKQNPQSES
jgi:hypothetical protein